MLGETGICPIKIELMEPSLESLFLPIIRILKYRKLTIQSKTAAKANKISGVNFARNVLIIPKVRKTANKKPIEPLLLHSEENNRELILHSRNIVSV